MFSRQSYADFIVDILKQKYSSIICMFHSVVLHVVEHRGSLNAPFWKYSKWRRLVQGHVCVQALSCDEVRRCSLEPFEVQRPSDRFSVLLSQFFSFSVDVCLLTPELKRALHRQADRCTAMAHSTICFLFSSRRRPHFLTAFPSYLFRGEVHKGRLEAKMHSLTPASRIQRAVQAERTM